MTDIFLFTYLLIYDFLIYFIILSFTILVLDHFFSPFTFHFSISPNGRALVNHPHA